MRRKRLCACRKTRSLFKPPDLGYFSSAAAALPSGCDGRGSQPTAMLPAPAGGWSPGGGLLSVAFGGPRRRVGDVNAAWDGRRGRQRQTVRLVQFSLTSILIIKEEENCNAGQKVPAKNSWFVSKLSCNPTFHFRDENVLRRQPSPPPPHFLGCCFWLRPLLQREIKIILLRKEANEFPLPQTPLDTS